MRRFRDVRAIHLADLGGEENCSEAEKSLVRRAALLTVELERMEVIAAQDDGMSDSMIGRYLSMAHNLKLLLQAVGIKRRPKDVTPTLETYLRTRSQQTTNGEGAL